MLKKDKYPILSPMDNEPRFTRTFVADGTNRHGEFCDTIGAVKMLRTALKMDLRAAKNLIEQNFGTYGDDNLKIRVSDVIYLIACIASNGDYLINHDFNMEH